MRRTGLAVVVSLAALLGGSFVSAAVGAPHAPARHLRHVSVTAKLSTPSSNYKQNIVLRGSVSPSYLGEKATVQRQAGRRWVQQARVPVVNGRYSLTFHPAAPGSFTYRVSTPRHGKFRAAKSGTVTEQVYAISYLIARQPAAGHWETGKQFINGTEYDHSVFETWSAACSGNCDSTELSYALNRHCSGLLTEAGLGDQTEQGDYYDLQILGDGKVLYDSGSQTQGFAQQVALNVGKISTLTFTVTRGTQLAGDTAYPAFGDPVVRCY